MRNSLSCYAFKLEIRDRLEARPTRVLLIFDTQFKCRTAYCQTCQATRLGDFWTGEIKSANSAANIPVSLVQIILEVYAYTDAIEQRKRAAHELVIDHRFPMERWGDNEPPHLASMSESEIKQKFQLLKKDASGNHLSESSFGMKEAKTGPAVATKRKIPEISASSLLPIPAMPQLHSPPQLRL
jgi:hypothetical protein